MRRSTKIFMALLVLTGIVLATGTVYAMLHDTRNIKLASRAVPEPGPGLALYTGIGRIRAATRDEPSALVLVYIVLPYEAADFAFRDELFLKKDVLRQAAIGFFADRKAVELRAVEELLIKAALRDTLNQYLMLGSVTEVFFAEFDVLP